MSIQFIEFNLAHGCIENKMLCYYIEVSESEENVMNKSNFLTV